MGGKMSHPSKINWTSYVEAIIQDKEKAGKKLHWRDRRHRRQMQRAVRKHDALR